MFLEALILWQCMEGLICLALTEEHCDRLKLDQMVKTNKSKHETAFTVSIEAEVE